MAIGDRLRVFPFDHHELRICVRPSSLELSRLQLVLWKDNRATEAQEESNEWQLRAVAADPVALAVSSTWRG